MAKPAVAARPIFPILLGVTVAGAAGYFLSRWLNEGPAGGGGAGANCAPCPPVPPLLASALEQYEKQKILVNQLRDIVSKFPGGSSLLATIGL